VVLQPSLATSVREPWSSPPRLRLSAYARLTGLGHPYFRLLHQALERHGVVIIDPVEIGVSWLRAHRERLDVVHFHWPERIWRRGRSERRGFVADVLHAIRELLRLARFLHEAHRLGIARVWTIHNLEPHEGASIWDWLGYQLIGRSADVVVAHSAWSLEQAKRRYRVKGRGLIMPMGTMRDAYPTSRPRDVVLEELGLDPRLPMVSCLGLLRGYKGLDLACAAIERLGGRVQLVVGGPPHASFDVERLRAAMGRLKSSVLLARELSDQEFADVMGASDAALLPYRNITGSAVLLTAIGFGRPVIAADLPYFREVLAAEPDAAALVASDDPVVWAEAIDDFLSRAPEMRREAVLRLADRYSWDRTVVPLVEALASPNART
jgi:beta-1,4-mannosyltransferase